MNTKRKHFGSTNSGAVGAEAALVIPIFAFALLFFVDMARYAYLTTVVNYAAYSGADLASKLDVAVPSDVNSCLGTNVVQCVAYRRRVIAVSAKVDQILSTLIQSDSPTSKVHFTQFRMYEDGEYTNPTRDLTLAAMPDSRAGFLRPGEVIRRVVPGNASYFDHPTRPAKSRGGAGWPNSMANESWERILVDNPIVVRVEATLQPYTPGFSPWRVVGTQLGYRRTPQVGVETAPLNSNPLTPVPASTNTPVPPTPVPTITPGGPTVTPLPTPTPTPIPTATPYLPCAGLACGPCDCIYNACVARGCIPANQCSCGGG